jgi:hypothetical protein
VKVWVSVGVRVKNGREVGVLALLGLKSSERKDKRPVKPAHINKITGMATNIQANLSIETKLKMGLGRRRDLGKPSCQAWV